MKANWVAYGLLAAGLLVLYGWLDPAVLPFPRCPFLTFTGFQCPGCGSQRAIHQFLQGNFYASFQLNPLFIPGILYAAVGYTTALFAPRHWATVRTKWYGTRAAKVALMIILIFWISRNFFSGGYACL